jgi:nitrogen-specific signal transduction histidine kinase
MSARYILTNSIDLFYVVTDENGVIIGSNDLFKEYSSHIKPKNVSEMISDDSDFSEFSDSVKRAKERAPLPIRFYAKTKQKNGSMRWNLWNIYFILNSLHFVGLPITDVTSITSHEYEKQKQLLEDFRFMLSHELRQPLTSIAGLVKMLIETDYSQTDEESVRLLEMVNLSVEQLDKSIHNLVKKATRQI